MIPIGSRHSVDAKIDLWQPVVCEVCSCQFAYRTTISGHGEAKNLLWLNKEGATASAQSQAMRELEERLAEVREKVSVYACPECGNYQSNMVSLLKADNLILRRMGCFFGALVFAWISAQIVTAVFSENMNGPHVGVIYSVIVLTGVFAGVSAGWLLWRFLASRPYEPNYQPYKRAGKPYSQSYPVLRLADLEKLIRKNQRKGKNNDILLPLR